MHPGQILVGRSGWLPEGDAPIPRIPAAMSLMCFAPRLLAALEAVLPYAESEAHALEKLKGCPDAEVEAERALVAPKAARSVITAATEDRPWPWIEPCPDADLVQGQVPRAEDVPPIRPALGNDPT